jgi:CHASE2 domain-containing sensor protein
MSTIAVLYWYGFLPLLWIETRCDDLRSRFARKAQVSNQIVFCGIANPSSLHFDESALKDDPTLRLLATPYPWSREVWASLLTTLYNANTKLVVFDLIFDTAREGDAAFKSVLDNNRSKVVMGCIFNPQIHGAPFIENWLTPHESILGTNWDDEPFNSDGVVGHSYVPQDWDGVMRSFQKNDYSHGQYMPIESLMAKAIRKIGESNVLQKCNQRQRFRFAGGPGTYPVIPVHEIFTPALWKTKFDNGRFFENKIVVVGAAGSWAKDQKKTPFPKAMDGTEVQINILDAMMQGELLVELTRAEALLVILLAGAAAFCIGHFSKSAVALCGAIAGGNTIYLTMLVCAYNYYGLLLPIACPLLVFNLSMVASGAMKLWQGRKTA